MSDNEVDVIVSDIAKEIAYEKLKHAAELSVKQKTVTRILQEFDEFCERHHIGYFVMARSLEGLVEFGDFIPDQSKMEIGMLQAEYDRFAELYQAEFSALAQEDLFWRLSSYLNEYPKVERRLPRLELIRPVPVQYADKRFYTKKGQLLKVSPSIEISIFNAVPRDTSERDKFYKELKDSNEFFEQVLAAHEAPKASGKNKGKSKKKEGLFSNLRAKMTSVEAARGSLAKLAKKYEGIETLFVARVLGKQSKTVELEALVPYQKRPFRNINLYCPAQVGIWVNEIETDGMDDSDDLLLDLVVAVEKVEAEFSKKTRT
jgi:hypothetical protein